jgi:hypothetical protein
MWGSGDISPPFLISALDGAKWLASSPSLFNPGEKVPGSHWIGDWVGSRAGVDAMEKRKSCPCRKSNPCRPARSPSLYRNLKCTLYMLLTEWVKQKMSIRCLGASSGDKPGISPSNVSFKKSKLKKQGNIVNINTNSINCFKKMFIFLLWMRSQKLALTSPRSGGRSVCIVRSPTKATEFSF